MKKTSKKLVIRFVGKRLLTSPETGKIQLAPRAAPERRTNGARVIELPTDAVQKKGFTHPDAEFLLKAYPKEFKRTARKGK